ncbi:MAG TPA: endolytic transglycosylase MltG [Alphaproteobacteria bacterium]|nr:endolytic transglycosylase MltG [Alphaproteobacteria bacterium]
MNILKSIAVTAILGLAIGFFAFMSYSTIKNNQEVQIFVIDFDKGESLSSLASDLKAKSLILNEDLFKIQAVVLDYDKKLQPGEYQLTNRMSGLDILKKISKGKVVYHRVTIPEGLTVKEIFELVKKEDKLDGKISVEIKEGYLLPETYTFRKGDTKNSVILQMQSAMERDLDAVWKSRDRSIDAQISSKQELLKLASIVEKETIIDREKPIVANVYLNRLKLGMKLQADPTVIYGAKNYQGDITYKMLREKNDFNTYVIFGLPKTAIANPGLESLKAVANPADTKYLFFVADGKGGHVFSENYEQHKKKVADYLKTLK